jgi:hypothetical protein
MTSPGPGLLRALADAAQTAAPQETARAVHRVLLCGSTGQVIATDGRQLLIQGGFTFPFKDEVLIPGVGVWGSKELPHDEEVLLGLGKESLTVSLGPWTLVLRVEPRGRFPPAESIVPTARGSKTRLRLGADDIALLCKELPRLPVKDEGTPLVRMEVGHDVVIRPHDSSRQTTAELKLSSAEVIGKAVSLMMNRRHLLRALKIGFNEVEIIRPDVPLCCRDSSRVFVWMPFTENGESSARPTLNSTPVQENAIVPDHAGKPSLNGDSNLSAAADPLSEAEGIKSLLTEGLTRVNRLIATLKQFRKQSKAVKAAVDSLRELPPLTP